MLVLFKLTVYYFLKRIKKPSGELIFGRGETTFSWGETTFSWGETTLSWGETTKNYYSEFGDNNWSRGAARLVCSRILFE